MAFAVNLAGTIVSISSIGTMVAPALAIEDFSAPSKMPLDRANTFQEELCHDDCDLYPSCLGIDSRGSN